MPLTLRREGAVLVLVNDNPAMRNALTADFYQDATAALDAAAADASIGAVVITGAGRFFSAGGDLNVLATRRSMTPPERRERLELLHGLIRAVRRLGKPVVAAVEGGAAGAGLSLALACDLVVASREAQFTVAYVKVGLTPDGGVTSFLAESLPRQLLAELCLTGDRIDAERLHALGAINRLVEPGLAETEALTLATRLGAGPERAMARIKDLCGSAHTTPLLAQLDREAAHMVDSQGDDEAAEGIGAFLGKRAADFSALRQRTGS